MQHSADINTTNSHVIMFLAYFFCSIIIPADTSELIIMHTNCFYTCFAMPIIDLMSINEAVKDKITLPVDSKENITPHC